ncbi:hypothetical protein AA106555_1444 [Neokomagataea thailandica NBRC 106555]|uniref:DUF721 domain-containing protein n=2 Tax=Neokomagataea TaxID=1223423 RepID=A0A4Y6V3R4_9PROT|nr:MULTISPECIES: DciA family protein [Neokomagataea]QDH24699.1 DUF721 domain-containing protein [Neokomagataea tanensis]GBR53803.1 hypothetical protein AA106555_1444 [Neokomagataea thailandica NBRC 106555]
MEEDRTLNKRSNEPNAQGKAPFKPKTTTYGTKQIGAFVTQITQPAFKKKSPILIRLALNWEEFVGPYIAQQTEPRRLSAGTLTLACSGPVAMELQHQSVQLLERINASCGLRGVHAIERIKLVQDHALRPVAPKTQRKLPAVSVEGVENDELRTALEQLGAYVKGKRPRR